MNDKKSVSPADAPAPFGKGHYSPGILTGNLVFTSGQGPIEPATNEILNGSISEQTRLTIDNIEAVLQAAGSDLAQIVKATIYLSDLKDWGVVDRIWGERVTGVLPARTAVGANLLAGMHIEIDVVAVSR